MAEWHDQAADTVVTKLEQKRKADELALEQAKAFGDQATRFFDEIVVSLSEFARKSNERAGNTVIQPHRPDSTKCELTLILGDVRKSALVALDMKGREIRFGPNPHTFVKRYRGRFEGLHLYFPNDQDHRMSADEIAQEFVKHLIG